MAWNLVETVSVPMAQNVLVGLAVTSHSPGALCTATFDNVSVTRAAPTPTPSPTRTPTVAPPSWTNKDIGVTSPAGSGTQSSGVFTVTGSGSDIWYASDQFHFYYQGLTGDGQIVAHATSVQDVNAWSKVGVMIRADLTVNSPYAFMLVTPEMGAASQHRASSGAKAAGPTITGVMAPVWLKLTRSGNNFTTAWSLDGMTWNVVETVTVPMAQNVLIGLAVTSHSPGNLCSATFDNVAITSL